MHLLILVGRVGDGLVETLEAAEFLFIGIEEDMVGACLGHADRIAKKGLSRMERKHKDQSTSSKGQDLLVRIEVELLGRRGGEELVLGSKLDHHFIPCVELTVAKVRRIHE